MPQRIVIAGVNGFIGEQLLPRLKAMGVELLLVDQDPAKLGVLFPEIPNCKYDKLAEKARDFDVFLNLADLGHSPQKFQGDFTTAYMDFLFQMVSTAKTAQIGRFVNFTRFHAMNSKGAMRAESRRAALDALAEKYDIPIINILSPVVYGDRFAGKLSIINKFPTPLRPAALNILAAFIPTLHIDKLVDFLIDEVNDVPDEVLLVNSQDENRVYRSVKRFVDILFSVMIIGVLGWILLIVWALVHICSKGPMIFSQTRVGKDGKPFTIYKIRTMKIGTRHAATYETASDALTKIGAFLRKAKIDEFPQAWNILRGDLSLVGPRPCIPAEEAVVTARKKCGVLSVLPGVTGLSQVNGIDTSNPARVAQSDAYYIAQRSLLLDFRIIIATLLGKGHGDRIRAQVWSDHPAE